ncbi:MAG: peptidylprolyl isomerase [Kofleriaceae bacterium]
MAHPAFPSSPRRARFHRLAVALTLAGSLSAAGCQRADKADKAAKVDTKPTTATPGGAALPPGPNKPPSAPAIDLDSKDILGRAPVTQDAEVKHVLIGWDDLASVYGPRMDKRAKDRTNQAAAELARQIAGKLKADPSAIDALVKEHSEDPGSLAGDPYTVTADAPFVPEFKNLALRLNIGEVGIVKTQFGYHVMERVAPPPPDPLQSSDILARPAGTETVIVQHVLIGWQDVPAAKQRPLDPRAQKRTKAEADALASEILAKVRGGADMVALMKEYSEDPGSKDGKTYDVGPSTGFVPEFKNLTLRLNLGEAGLVKTAFGWHIIKRVPPPPPDKLESAAILARAPVTDKAKVKHILVGDSELNAGDERAKKRTRAQLEALVAKTVAALAKGAKIEPLMKELSEDPGSAASGTSYDVDPNAGLVAPFKNLSLRLNVGETGVVKTQFGFHIIQRTE